MTTKHAKHLARRSHNYLSPSLLYLVSVIISVALTTCLPATRAGQNVDRPVLQMPVSDTPPLIDGKLDEACWKDATAIDRFIQEQGEPPKSNTGAFVLRDDEHLYVGVTCELVGDETIRAESAPSKDISDQEHVAVLIDSNLDRNSYYLILLTQKGTVQTSYNEHFPPWHDPTWSQRKLRFKCSAATSENGWSAEFSFPLASFDKNKTLNSKIGFNIARHDVRAGQTYCWRGTFLNPADAGVLAEIPARESFPTPPLRDYAGYYQTEGGFRQALNIPLDANSENSQDRPAQLGPGSTHPVTTGEVRIELEQFLMGGNVHARALIWDLAVDEEKGELYVLSAARRKSAIELRVFDRQGDYLRTIMPLNPTLSKDSVKDVCQDTVSEGSVDLVVPKLFETCGTEPSLYGEYYHLPQSMVFAPNGDLIMSNLFKRTLWRMKPDGSLPPEGWTSIHNPQRNEPFEYAGWLIGPWHAERLKPYLSYGKFCLPDMCFDKHGDLYVSGGLWSPLSQFYSTNWEVPGRGQGEAVWKYQLLHGTGLAPIKDFRFNGKEETGTGRDHLGVEGQPGTDEGHFNQPCGLAVVAEHLIVADSGNDRLQVFESDGRLAASIGSFDRKGQEIPLLNPTALTVDHEQCVYVLAVVEGERRLIKLASWREPRLLAASDPLHADTIRVALDGGVDPPLVWIANGAGRGSLLQLSGDDLSLKGSWADDAKRLSSPGQYGFVPILNIDPQTGHLYVEDDTYYHRGVYGEVYRLDQEGSVLKQWPPVPFNPLPDWNGEPIYSQAHAIPDFRYPEEPLFLDSFFGKDGRVYRWKRGAKTVEILRFDRDGKPLPFATSGTHILTVDQLPQRSVQPRNHFVYRGLDVDADGNIYHVNSRNSVDVYDSDGNPRSRDLLQLIDTRSLLVGGEGSLYVLSCPRSPARMPEGQWTSRELFLTKFPSTGGEPLWTRRWDGVVGCGAGRVAWMQTTCVCLTPRLHQALDGRGYLYIANRFSVQVIDCDTGALAGEFGSYGNMDCLGKSSDQPHPELPFGTISALAVWKDQLYVVDAMNARIAKCRLIYDAARKTRRP